MHALIHDRFGEPADVIQEANLPAPLVPEGQVAVRVMLSPIHNHDLATIRGTYGYKPDLPAVAGTEFLGEFEGRRVVATGHGAWAETIVVPRQSLVPVPEAIPDETAAQLLAMPLSAVVLFHELGVKRGAWIAQNAAGGAVGRILMRLAQAADVHLVNFVRSASSAEELRKLGAQYVVDTSESDWAAKARLLTGGKGFERIVDSVAGSGTLELQRLLQPFGTLVIFGGLSGAAVKLDPSLMISLECNVRGFWMTSWMRRATDADRMQAMQQVFTMALAGALPLPVAGVYGLSQAAIALKAAETPGRGGKVLFKPS